MKTTIEIPDELLECSRMTAQREGSTLRALMEEGLRLVLKLRMHQRTGEVQFPIYGGSGLTEEFRGAGWDRIQDEIYCHHGA